MKVLGFFKKFYNVYLIFVLAMLVVLPPFVGYTFKRNYTTLNPVHFIIGLGLVALAIFILVKMRKNNPRLWNFLHSEHGFNRILLIGCIVLFVLQIIICAGCWFVVGWDVRNVTIPDMQTNTDYMSMYPNQLFLAGAFHRIYNLFLALGLSWDAYYFFLVVLACLATLFTVIFITLVAKREFELFCGIITFFIGAIYFGLSPWIMIPYSDNFAMVSVCCCLWLFSNVRRPYVKWPLIFLVAIIGYEIKPTAIFVLLAIVFVHICVQASKLWKCRKLCKAEHCCPHTPKVIIASAALICIAIAISIGTTNFVVNYGVSVDESKAFGPQHFAMMGLSYENRGAWNQDDVSFSRSFDTCEERNQAALNEFINRAKNLGPLGVTDIYINKTLTNYGDATFAWEAETPWNVENKGTNKLLWFIYGIDQANNHNDTNNLFDKPMAAMWLMFLLGAILNIRRKTTATQAVCACSLLCISAFLMIFEPDPRYLMLYAPFILLLSVGGWQDFAKRILSAKTSIR